MYRVYPREVSHTQQEEIYVEQNKTGQPVTYEIQYHTKVIKFMLSLIIHSLQIFLNYICRMYTHIFLLSTDIISLILELLFV